MLLRGQFSWSAILSVALLTFRYGCLGYRNHLAKPDNPDLELEDSPLESIHSRNDSSFPYILFYPPTRPILPSSDKVRCSRLREEESGLVQWPVQLWQDCLKASHRLRSTNVPCSSHRRLKVSSGSELLESRLGKDFGSSCQGNQRQRVCFPQHCQVRVVCRRSSVQTMEWSPSQPRNGNSICLCCCRSNDPSSRLGDAAAYSRHVTLTSTTYP